MKVPKKGKDLKTKVINKGAVCKVKPLPSKEQVLVVAQEIKYARLLSGNEKKTRDKVLKSLKKWLRVCFETGYEFEEDDFIRMWKGLFYAMWMSDKPLVQEELCDSICDILDLFPAEQLKHALLMTKAGFRTLATEWYGIDQHRMDKFLMLVRRYLRGSLRCLSRCDWSVESCQKYAKMLSSGDGIFALKTPRYARNALSMRLHIVDCFLDELAKVSGGKIPDESVASLLRPFSVYMCLGTDAALCGAARRLHTALLRQSEAGLRYQEKTRAWQQMGCPVGGPDALEVVEDDEEDTEGQENGDANDEDDGEKPLDPRAGRIDVVLPLLKVPAALLAASLRGLLPSATSKAHQRTRICIERFETLAKGQYPLPVPDPRVLDMPVVAPKRSLRALRALETKIKSDKDELKLRGLSRKHRKRLLKRARMGHSIVEEVLSAQKASKKKSKSGEWLVESTKQEPDKDTSNKENLNTKKERKQKRKLDPEQNGEGVAKKQKVEKLDPEQNGEGAAKKQKVEKTKKTDDSPKKVNDAKLKKIQGKDPGKQTHKESPTIAKTDKKKAKVEPPKLAKAESPKHIINKLKDFKKELQKTKEKKKDALRTDKDKRGFDKEIKHIFDTPKKVKFQLKNNSMQKPLDYYKSVRSSPSIPFDGARQPRKTNLKPSAPSPINPFFKRKQKKSRF